MRMRIVRKLLLRLVIFGFYFRMVGLKIGGGKNGGREMEREKESKETDLIIRIETIYSKKIETSLRPKSTNKKPNKKIVAQSLNKRK